MSTDKDLPPGPSRRADMLTEAEQRKLRQGKGGNEEEQKVSQAEGEPDGKPKSKTGKTPGQSEGDRQTVEEEIERRDKGEK
jgi:hypothetical protein